MSSHSYRSTLMPHHRVVGYHGTHRQHAAGILSSGFQSSKKSYDWLGNGWYLWQDDRERAREWALEIHGDGATVIEAVIDISRCFDLIQRRYLVALEKHADQILGRLAPERLENMRQTDLLHDVDCALIEAFCTGRKKPDGSYHFTTVRGCFKEGKPVYDLPLRGENRSLRSALNSMDHIQIAVRDNSAIVDWRELGL